MSSGENIKNSLQVIFKTYENIQKLMEYCKTIADEKTNYSSAVQKFLRKKSDLDFEGWLISDFILLFQDKNGNECESGNGWKNDPIYVMEICLGEKGKENLPLVYLSKFEYSNMEAWGVGSSPAEHWRFYYPLRRADLMNFSTIGEYKVATPKNDSSSKTYWSLTKIVTKTISLFDISANNVQEKIFDEFAALSRFTS